MTKPELLVPAGNIEAFNAALEAGADAVYLGLRKFNARERARNFTVTQLKSMLKQAGEQGIKIYVTLNTLIRNSEISELFDVLLTLEKLRIDAIIIQDFGLYYLARNYFPGLNLHASTQMGNHNSLGVKFSGNLGIERVIMARELTYPELSEIKKKTKTELEIFIHGALCYSFSGMCLFSSFLGGMSANRGNCRQPCRRRYSVGNNKPYLFNLKDNQQADNIARFAKLGITSLKIEGRMKSAEYVYNTTKAYRLLLDSSKNKKTANELLASDLGREKTTYFLGGNIKEAISDSPYAGKKAGTVLSCTPYLKLKLSTNIKVGDRLRVLSETGFDSSAFKIKQIKSNGNLVSSASEGSEIELPEIKIECNPKDQAFLVNTASHRFSSKLKYEEKARSYRYSDKKKRQIISGLTLAKPPSQKMLFVRINNLKWLRKIHFNSIDQVILNLDQDQLHKFELTSGFLKNQADHLIIQLPRFISEKSLGYFQKEIIRLYRAGIRQFAISHLSQKLLFEHLAKIKLYTTENIYVLNDAAAALLKQQKITNWIYPFENDFPNLISGKDRRGIVPLFFYPELFYSRMPVGIDNNEKLKDKSKLYRKVTTDGVTVIIPEHPVSLLQFHKRLQDKGFKRFLIDFSWVNPSANTFNRIIKKFDNSQPEQPATTFNFKMGLK